MGISYDITVDIIVLKYLTINYGFIVIVPYDNYVYNIILDYLSLISGSFIPS